MTRPHFWIPETTSFGTRPHCGNCKDYEGECPNGQLGWICGAWQEGEEEHMQDAYNAGYVDGWNDSTKVIRCGECKYAEDATDCPDTIWCLRNASSSRGINDYCSKAKLRGEE